MVWNNGAANTYKYHCRENHSRPISIDDPVSQANNCIHYYFEDELIGAMQRASKVEAAHIDQIITRAMRNKAQSIFPCVCCPRTTPPKMLTFQRTQPEIEQQARIQLTVQWLLILIFCKHSC